MDVYLHPKIKFRYQFIQNMMKIKEYSDLVEQEHFHVWPVWLFQVNMPSMSLSLMSDIGTISRYWQLKMLQSNWTRAFSGILTHASSRLLGLSLMPIYIQEIKAKCQFIQNMPSFEKISRQSHIVVILQLTEHSG